MSKKKLSAIIAVVLAVIIAVSVVFVVKNKNTNEEETTTEAATVERATEEDEAGKISAEEKSEASASEETETTEKEKLTIEKTTVKKSGVAPDKNKDTYEVLYKKEHIIGVKVKLWGTYLKEIKSAEPVARFSAEYETASQGEDEGGPYTVHKTEGHSYHFDLKTKKGYREDWSVGSTVRDETGETIALSDGFPEKQKEYDAVEINYEKDCVVLTFILDKPLKYKDVNADFEISIDENIFGTEFGIGNFKFSDMWFSYPDAEF